MDEQSFKQLHIMDTLDNAYGAVKAWRTGRLSEDQAKVIAWLTKIGVM